MKMLVLDGNSLVNRAFYGVRSTMTSHEGIPTNAVFGFFMMLRKLEQQNRPDAVAVAFDLPEPTFRHKMFDGYKATRHAAPEELRQQFPIIRELLEKLGYPIVTAPGFEADDILGTLSRACAEKGADCILCTGDRDSYQLIGDHVAVQYATQNADADVYDEERIREKYGVTPKQLIQVKALMGDSSDNIPGVPGIGEKTALALIAKFGSVEALYANLGDPAVKPGVRQKLEAGAESAQMSLRLAEINRDVPIPTDPELYRRKPGDPGAAAALFARLDMKKLLENLGLDKLANEAVQDRPEGTAEAEKKPVECTACRPEELPEGTLDLRLTPEAAVFSRLDEASNRLCFCTVPMLELGTAEPLFRRPLRVHDVKEAVRTVEEAGFGRPDICFSSELAAYLLDSNGSDYAPEKLYGSYSISAEAEGAAGECLRYARLCGVLEGLIAERGQEKLLREIEIPLAYVLEGMERLGFRVDADGILRFGDRLSVDIEALRQRIYEEAGGAFNINSPKQLGEVLFERMGLPCKKKTKTGYSTNVDVLEALRPVAPVVGDVLEYRKLTKLKSTYVEGLYREIEADGRIHSRFNQTETRTGRISSTEPNLQNIPVRTELGREMRRFFVAEPGWLLLDADYSQIELRVLAAISGDPAMTEAFLSGEDIHTQTASQVFGLPADMITSELRRRAKAVNFGIVYGISAHSLAEDLSVPYGEAAQYIRDYLRTYAGVDAYMKETVERAKEQGYVTTLFGRRRDIPELKSSNGNLRAFGERAAMNAPIQGTAADIIKIAMIRVQHRLEEEKLRARLILQVHDELIVEAPEAEAGHAAEILQYEMEHAVSLRVPMLVEVHQGKDWFTAKG